jgi:hypothetical protein
VIRDCRGTVFSAAFGTSVWELVQPGSSRAPVRNAFDLGADQPFDHARQIVIEPSFQHRPQHLADQVLECPGILHQEGLRQRVESGVDCSAGLPRKKLGTLPIPAQA